MIVYFAASSPSYFSKMHTIRDIEAAVKSSGHTLAGISTADAPTNVEMSLGILDQEEWELMYQREMSLLKQADVAILEVSDKATFGVGYLAAHALISNKPTLFLLEENSIKGSFTAGLKHKSLTRKLYNEQNIHILVGDFLRGCKK